MDKRTTLYDKVVKDNHGRVSLWQTPNSLLIAWLIATVVSKLLHEGQWKLLAETIAFGAIFGWAWLELFRGVNYFRRALGLVVLVSVVWAHVR